MSEIRESMLQARETVAKLEEGIRRQKEKLLRMHEKLKDAKDREAEMTAVEVLRAMQENGITLETAFSMFSTEENQAGGKENKDDPEPDEKNMEEKNEDIETN
jgi:hypothetical protein